jgi:hypothetical protein
MAMNDGILERVDAIGAGTRMVRDEEGRKSGLGMSGAHGNVKRRELPRIDRIGMLA